MPFPGGPSPHGFPRVRPSRSGVGGPVLAVGRRVVVTCPGGKSGRVTLMDHAGTTAQATVADGVEVEILAWQPYRAGGPRYRVLSKSGGVEGWLGAENLKAVSLPPPAMPPVVAAPARVKAPSRSPGAVAPRPGTALVATAAGAKKIVKPRAKSPKKTARRGRSRS